MKYLTQMLAYTRLLVLSRQWKSIREWLFSLPPQQEARLAALVHAQASIAEKHPAPQFFGSDQVASYSPWGDAADKAYELSRAGDAREQMEAVALWLAVVYYETRRAPIEALRSLHREAAHDFERLRDLHDHLLAIRRVA